MMKRSLMAAAMVATLTLGFTPGARAEAETKSGLGALAGPGGKLELTWDRAPDGSGGTMRTRSLEDGTFARMEIEGLVSLRSTSINLDSEYLLYDAVNEMLTARGNVEVEQEGVESTCEELFYNLATGEVEMNGSPIVNQISPERTARFEGMEQFFLIPKEGSDEKEIRLLGGEVITCNITPTTPAEDATPEATAVPASEAGAPATGFGALGESVLIATRAGRGVDPAVYVTTTATNEMNTFEARGEVTLDTDDLYLRSDQLFFNGPDELLEAMYNVFLRQAAIEADCQKLSYDLAKDRIELTGNPIIRKDEGAQIMRISDIVSFVINRYPDGSSDTEVDAGVGRRGRTEFLPKAGAAPKVEEDTGPREIDLNDPNALLNIRR